MKLDVIEEEEGDAGAEEVLEEVVKVGFGVIVDSLDVLPGKVVGGMVIMGDERDDREDTVDVPPPTHSTTSACLLRSANVGAELSDRTLDIGEVTADRTRSIAISVAEHRRLANRREM